MEEKPQREKYKKTEEEFVGEGLAKNIKGKDSRSGQPDYGEWSLRELQREAEKMKVRNFMEMKRDELIARLKSKH